MNWVVSGSESFPEKVLLCWEFKTYQREIKLLWVIHSKIILWLRFMTWSYTAHHKFISRSLGFMSALHSHHIIMRFGLTHHNLFLIIHYFSRVSCLCRIYLFIFNAKLEAALMLPPLHSNPVIMWFGRMDGRVFKKKQNKTHNHCFHRKTALPITAPFVVTVCLVQVFHQRSTWITE